MKQHIPAEISTGLIDWNAFVTIDNMMPPRDPDDDDDEEDEEDEEDEDDPPVVREPDED